jgi:hypothetical protein
VIVSLVGQICRAAEPARFLRFHKGESVAYGLLEGDRVRQLSGDLFGTWAKAEKGGQARFLGRIATTRFGLSISAPVPLSFPPFFPSSQFYFAPDELRQLRRFVGVDSDP